MTALNHIQSHSSNHCAIQCLHNQITEWNLFFREREELLHFCVDGAVC